jgi:hypothetical protein
VGDWEYALRASLAAAVAALRTDWFAWKSASASSTTIAMMATMMKSQIASRISPS